LVGLLLGVASPCAAEIQRALLSVEGLSIPSGKSIFAYRIETFGVEFLAMCRLPTSWALKSEKFENPAGYLSGRADVHGAPLRSLTNLYLVDVYDYQAVATRDGPGEQPASFAGWIEVGSRQAFGDWRGRKVKLRASNFRLMRADRCPAQPPPQP
jgi:hypothetical protein